MQNCFWISIQHHDEFPLEFQVELLYDVTSNASISVNFAFLGITIVDNWIPYCFILSSRLRPETMLFQFPKNIIHWLCRKFMLLLERVYIRLSHSVICAEIFRNSHRKARPFNLQLLFLLVEVSQNTAYFIMYCYIYPFYDSFWSLQGSVRFACMSEANFQERLLNEPIWSYMN